MSASLKINTTGLKRVAEAFKNPAIEAAILQIPHRRAMAALIGQAIADNFAQEGPGWAPLKASTIRQSVAKKVRKSLANMSDEEIIAHEAKARKKESTTTPYRQILRKTGLLYKTATTPGYSGSNKTGQSGKNIWKVEGNNLIWGTDLVYASAMNNGNPKKNVPARPFMTIRQQWMKQIEEYVINEAFQIVWSKLRGAKS